MTDKHVTLETAEDALAYLEQLAGAGDAGNIEDFELGTALKELQIIISGPNYNGQLTGEIAKALGQYQDAIYSFAKIVIFDQPNARLTVEQKKELELLIDVNEGSLDLKVNFGKLFDALKEPLSKMSPESARTLIISLALIATLGITTYTLGTRALENKDRADQREHVAEVLKTTLESNNQTIDTALNFLDAQLSRESEQVARSARSSIAAMSKAQTVGLTEVAKAAPDATELAFGTSVLDQDAIQTMSQRSPRALADRFDAEGEYQVLAETLPGGITKVTFHGKDLPGEITVDFSEDEFTKAQSDALWDAIRDRTSVYVKLQATLIRGSVKGGVLVDIVAD